MYWTEIFNKRGFSKITRPKTLEVVPKELLSKNSNKTSRFLLTMFLLSLKYPLKESCYFLFDVKIVLGNFLFLYSAQPKQSIIEQKCAKKCLLNRAYKPQRRTSALVLVFSSNPNIVQEPSVGMQSSRKQAWTDKQHMHKAS